MPGPSVVCSMCGSSPERTATGTEESLSGQASDDADAQIPMSWVRSVERGVTRLYCDRCSREHLRSIEAKLDAEYW